MARQVVIVGGGISGLAAAWWIRERATEEVEITVLERESRPGGTAWTEQVNGYRLETGPNGFLDNKPEMLELCRSLGLERDLIRADSSAARRFLFLGDRLRELPANPIRFLRSDLLSWRGKLRTVAERWIPPKRTDDEESIADFGRRRLGREATEKLLDAFATGILAGDTEKLSLAACFPRIAELEAEFGSLIRAQIELRKRRRLEGQSAVGSPGGNLTVTEGGVGVVIRTLKERLGDSVRLGRPVTSLAKDSAGHWLARSGEKAFPADAMVLACPAPEQAELLRDSFPSLAQEISEIPYTTAVVAAVGYRSADLGEVPKGFGYLSPQRLERPVLGVLWSSSIFPGQAPDGTYQFRAILGGWRRRDVLEWDDAEVIRAVREDLAASLGIRAEPCFHWIYRWPKAIPQYHVGHLDRLRRIDGLLDDRLGLFLTGNAYRGVALNDCARESSRVADQVLAYLAQEAQGS